jgi:poly-beta-1,6-N-acetyl-D-glucosamine synthase
MIGLDGCTDATADLIASESNGKIKVFEFKKRRGKAAVINDLVLAARSEILVFSDANTMYEPDAVGNLVRHFAEEKIGGVCGNLELIAFNKKIGSVGESGYWKYENKLKSMEVNIWRTIGATGAIYAVRRSLYKELPIVTNVTDDFIIPLGIVEKGYRMVYDREAKGHESTTPNPKDEFSRKVRIGTANSFVLGYLKHLLNPRWGFISFALWSHKVIRWFVPLLMIPALLTNVALYAIGDVPVYTFLLVSQIIFYGAALIGHILDKYNVSLGILGFPYYFVSMHYGLFVGMIKFLVKRRQPTWGINR